MLKIDIPGSATLVLTHLVLDYNGTIAIDGEPLPGVREKLWQLSELLDIHVITADTYGTVREKLSGYPLQVEVIGPTGQDAAKEAYVEKLGQDYVVAIGNGRNDGRMLARARVGIGVIQQEGAASEVLVKGDVLCTDIIDALELLLHTDRLRATLRN